MFRSSDGVLIGELVNPAPDIDVRLDRPLSNRFLVPPLMLRREWLAGVAEDLSELPFDGSKKSSAIHSQRAGVCQQGRLYASSSGLGILMRFR